MYTQSFGLSREPFSIAPDPRFLYMSERHREALAHLMFGIKGGGGFVLLTGEVGAGKTTVCRCLIGQLPEDCRLAYVFNPKLSVRELLKTVCDEYGIETPDRGTVKDHIDPLNRFLLAEHAAGRHCVLIIDEAQNLSPEVLEQLRLLTNLETDTRKLLQIVLIGQPELRDKLAAPGMEQLSQRIVARYHLGPLDEAETPTYVRHRLAVAGLRGALPFDKAALRRIHRWTRGVPRRINVLCDRALLGAYAQGRTQVGAATVDRAAREVFAARGRDDARRPQPWAMALTGLAALAVLGVGGWAWQRSHEAPAAAVAAPVATPEATAPAASAVPALAAAAAASAAVPAAAPAAVPLLDAATLAARLPQAWTDEAGAWRALWALWHRDRSALEVGDPCPQLASQGLACWRGRATLAQIRQLDRPGWLTLQVAGGEPARALLTGIGDQHAELATPQGAVRVTLATLATLWQGDFATLWRTPPGWSGETVVRPGGPLADWLLARLGDYQSGALPLDVPLAARIEAFQRAQGLQPDGVAGPLTLMQLNRAVAVAEPRLAGTEP